MTPCPVTSGLHFLFHAGSITPVSNGTAVTSYFDLSGKGNNASFYNATYRTSVFPNGLPSVRCVSGAMYGTLSAWGTAGSFAIVASIPTPSPYAGMFCLHNGSSGNDYQQTSAFYLSNSTADYNSEFKSSETVLQGTVCIPSRPAVLGVGTSSSEAVICDGTGVVRRYAGTNTIAAHTQYIFASRYVGASVLGSPNSSMDLGICAVWNRLPSEAEISSISQWASREIGTIIDPETQAPF